MYIYRMLYLNRIREYKRLISNMLFPLLSLVLIAGFMGYQMIVLLFPILQEIKKFNVRNYYCIILVWVIYSGYCCFIKTKPVISVKPASIFFLSENRLNKLMYVKFMGLAVKHFILALFLTICINGVNFNRHFYSTIMFVFCVLNAGCLLRWKIYHKGKRTWQDAGIWFLLWVPTMSLNVRPYVVIITVGVWVSMVVYDLLALKLNVIKYEDEMQFAEKILVAQNYNNTVLLNQYAKEKKVRYLPKRKNVPKLLSSIIQFN